MGRYKNICRKLLSAGLIVGSFLFASPTVVLAAEYSCGTYGAGAYQNNVCDSSDLADTGQPIWPFLIAVVFILAGTYMLYRTRKKMRQKAVYQAASRSE